MFSFLLCNLLGLLAFYSEMVSIKLCGEDGSPKMLLVYQKLLISSGLMAKLNPIFMQAKFCHFHLICAAFPEKESSDLDNLGSVGNPCHSLQGQQQLATIPARAIYVLSLLLPLLRGNCCSSLSVAITYSTTRGEKKSHFKGSAIGHLSRK